VVSLLKTIRTLWFSVDGIRVIDNSRILCTIFTEFCENYLGVSKQRYNNNSNNNNNNNNILLSSINVLRHVL